MKFKNHYNSVPAKGEVNLQPSLTVPDQTMSIQELMSRHVRGLSLGGTNVPIYEGEEDDFPDLSRMDKIDRIEALRDAQKELMEIKEQLNQKKKTIEDKKRRDAIDKEIEKELAAARKEKQKLEEQKQSSDNEKVD